MNYLTDEILKSRGNIDLLINTRVTTLTYKKSSSLSVNGVTVQQTRAGTVPSISKWRHKLNILND